MGCLFISKGVITRMGAPTIVTYVWLFIFSIQSYYNVTSFLCIMKSCGIIYNALNEYRVLKNSYKTQKNVIFSFFLICYDLELFQNVIGSK
jgi:hypothetical protein